MVAILKEDKVQIQKVGISPSCERFLREELSFIVRNDLGVVVETSSYFKVFGTADHLYHLIRRIAQRYTIELL